MAKLCGVANIIFTQTLLLGWKNSLKSSSNHHFLGWYASTKRKRHGESLWPFFWLKATEVGWLASIFGLQVEDTLHFCCFPSNIAIIQSSQSSNNFLSVSLLQIRNTSKDLGLGCWTSNFFVGQPKSPSGCVGWTVTNALQYWNLGPFFLLRTR